MAGHLAAHLTYGLHPAPGAGGVAASIRTHPGFWLCNSPKLWDLATFPPLPKSWPHHCLCLSGFWLGGRGVERRPRVGWLRVGSLRNNQIPLGHMLRFFRETLLSEHLH